MYNVNQIAQHLNIETVDVNKYLVLNRLRLKPYVSKKTGSLEINKEGFDIVIKELGEQEKIKRIKNKLNIKKNNIESDKKEGVYKSDSLVQNKEKTLKTISSNSDKINSSENKKNIIETNIEINTERNIVENKGIKKNKENNSKKEYLEESNKKDIDKDITYVSETQKTQQVLDKIKAGNKIMKTENNVGNNVNNVNNVSDEILELIKQIDWYNSQIALQSKKLRKTQDQNKLLLKELKQSEARFLKKFMQ